MPTVPHSEHRGVPVYSSADGPLIIEGGLSLREKGERESTNKQGTIQTVTRVSPLWFAVLSLYDALNGALEWPRPRTLLREEPRFSLNMVQCGRVTLNFCD